MALRFTVELQVDVDLDAYALEYGEKVTEALRLVLADLREPASYLTGEKWRGLAHIREVKAQLNLFTPAQLDRLAKVLSE